MKLSVWDPFREMDQMREQMNQLFSRSWDDGALAMPATDVYEQAGKLVVEANLPNMKPEDVDIKIHDGVLDITAEHKAESGDKAKDKKYYRREISYASYRRQIALPRNVDADKAEADYEDGVLRVSFPLEQLPEPKKLQIKTSRSGAKTLKTGDDK